MTASANVVIDPVPVATVLNGATGKIGYLHFTDHIASSEAKLIAAVNSFKAQGINDLVLDLRYNGGGFLYIADELAYMIAGPDRVSGKFFEKLAFNAKRTADNAEAATPFANTSCILDANFNCTSAQPLPTLNLSRVYVIAEDSTCSASESIINGLSGVDVQVFLIGSTTCGKPYGFTAHDNCGVSYFPIEFKGVNYKGFGDYADGFTCVCQSRQRQPARLPGGRRRHPRAWQHFGTHARRHLALSRRGHLLATWWRCHAGDAGCCAPDGQRRNGGQPAFRAHPAKRLAVAQRSSLKEKKRAGSAGPSSSMGVAAYLTIAFSSPFL